MRFVEQGACDSIKDVNAAVIATASNKFGVRRELRSRYIKRYQLSEAEIMDVPKATTCK